MTFEEAARIMMSGGGSGTLQDKEVRTSVSQLIKADKGYDALNSVNLIIDTDKKWMEAETLFYFDIGEMRFEGFIGNSIEAFYDSFPPYISTTKANLIYIRLKIGGKVILAYDAHFSFSIKEITYQKNKSNVYAVGWDYTYNNYKFSVSNITKSGTYVDFRLNFNRAYEKYMYNIDDGSIIDEDIDTENKRSNISFATDNSSVHFNFGLTPEEITTIIPYLYPSN